MCGLEEDEATGSGMQKIPIRMSGSCRCVQYQKRVR